MSEQLINDLKKAISEDARKPLIVCGAGVSIAATNGSAPSWAKLIEAGIDKVVSLDPDEEDWATFARSRLKKGKPAEWIEVADHVTRSLGGSGNAEFAQWISASVGQLGAVSRDLVDAIAGLGCPVATTNYDDVLANGLGLPPITWDDPDQVARFLRGELRGVLHLHGHWMKPATVVLGSASYAALLDDSKKEVLSNYASLDRSAIYIGCSADGLGDPDFTHLGSFVSSWQQSAPRSYWLVREDQRAEAKAFVSDSNPRLFPVVFGAGHGELTDFLRRLAPRTELGAAIVPSFVPIDQQEPCPEIFGREGELASIEEALVSGHSALIGGGPGMGKTALAVSALYRPGVRAHFGDRRIFVSIETESEPRALLASLAAALGLPSSGEEAALLRQVQLAAKEAPLVAVLDNAEGVFDAHRREAERVLRLIGQIEGLALVLTIRGVPPRLPGAQIIDDLLKLSPEASKAAFAAIVGPQVERDPDLDPLVETLDGHALSIDLVAARAQSGGSLAAIREAWRELRVDFLTRIGEAEGRLTSVGASLALSLESKIYTDNPFAKRLLGLLALLPAGHPENLAPKLLGERGAMSKRRAIEAIGILRTLRLVEKRLDGRLRMLTPLREAAQVYVSAMPQDRSRLLERYAKVLGAAGKIGTADWANVRTEVEPEAGNFQSIVNLFLVHHAQSKQTRELILEASSYYRITSQGSIDMLQRAISLYEHAKRFDFVADLSQALADIFLERENYSIARKLYMDALNMATFAKRWTTVANCHKGLGDVEGQDGNIFEARKHYVSSLEKYREVKSINGQANATFRLAMLAEHCGAPEAEDLYERALDLYRAGGAVGALGEANALGALGDIRNINFESCLRDVIGRYKLLGHGRNEATARIRLAILLQGDGRLVEALEELNEAFSVARRVGELAAEGVSMIVRGIVTRKEGAAGWRQMTLAGFELLWLKLSGSQPAAEGFRCLQEYLLAEDPLERQAAMERTREAWTRRLRHDLIRFWLRDPVHP